MISLPWLTTEQMVEVDRAMIEDYRIELIQMMENAGRQLAHLARRRFLGGDPRGRSVVVLAGPGGNGGGALVGARRLHGWGARVAIGVAHADREFRPVPAQQLDTVRRIGIPVRHASELLSDSAPDLIVDGLIGYGLQGDPRGETASLIRWANRSAAPVLALDVPSGVDPATGSFGDPAIEADATMTLALPKVGLRAPGAAKYVGELYLADIGVPPELAAGPGLGLEVGPIFAQDDLLHLTEGMVR